MTVAPQPVPPERADSPEPARSRASYDWTSIKPGEWQNWLNLTAEDIADEDSLKAANRIRLAARDYAHRHGMRLESRSENHGRLLDLRFTRRDT